MGRSRMTESHDIRHFEQIERYRGVTMRLHIVCPGNGKWFLNSIQHGDFPPKRFDAPPSFDSLEAAKEAGFELVRKDIDAGG